MNTIVAFAMGQANRGREQRIFDWHKAASLIKEHEAVNASAGLSGDWGCTGGVIFEDGKPVPAEDTYTYLASTWATPEIDIDGITYDCYKMQSEVPDWDANTYWPVSALKILSSDD